MNFPPGYSTLESMVLVTLDKCPRCPGTGVGWHQMRKVSFLYPHPLASPLSGHQGSLNLGPEASVDVPHPWLYRRPARWPGTLLHLCLLQTDPALAPRALGPPLPHGSTKAQRKPSRSAPLATLTLAPHWAAGRVRAPLPWPARRAPAARGAVPARLQLLNGPAPPLP